MKPILKSAALGVLALTVSGISARGATITFSTGTFTDNTVLTLAGTAANEVYGVELTNGFGGNTSVTTANGYAFNNAYISGEPANTKFPGPGTVAGNFTATGQAGGYHDFLLSETGSDQNTSPATTGDTNLDNALTHGLYADSSIAGTLNNLTIGQTYNVLVLLTDTRSLQGINGRTFQVSDGTNTSPSQQYAFQGGNPSVGGYALGTFTADAATQTLDFSGSGGGQANVLLVENAVPEPSTWVIGVLSVGALAFHLLRRRLPRQA